MGTVVRVFALWAAWASCAAQDLAETSRWRVIAPSRRGPVDTSRGS